MPSATRYVALLLAVLGSNAAPVLATNLVSSDGFESPTFSPGTIEGQDQWLSAGSGGSVANVQSSVVLDGTQALQVDRAASSDRFWAQRISSQPSGRFISIDWDMLVESTSAPSSAFGPFFGVNAFDDSSGSIGVLGSLGVDATTGEVLFQIGGSGILQAAGQVDFGTWSHYRIELDFQSESYRAFVDDALVASTGFVDAFLGLDRLTDADIVAFAAAGDSVSQSLVGTAYFDNFLVRDGLRADFNNDGLVDAADYTTWRDADGQVGFGLDADGNADGSVDVADYQLWEASFGASNNTSVPSSVPEPTGWLLSLSVGLYCGVGQRR